MTANGLDVYGVAVFSVTSVWPMLHCLSKDLLLTTCSRAAIS